MITLDEARNKEKRNAIIETKEVACKWEEGWKDCCKWITKVGKGSKRKLKENKKPAKSIGKAYKCIVEELEKIQKEQERSEEKMDHFDRSNCREWVILWRSNKYLNP